jgi:hypothetical protein
VSAISRKKVGFFAPSKPVSYGKQLDVLAYFLDSWFKVQKFPRAEDCIDSTWNQTERFRVVAYLKDPKHNVFAEYGTALCRLCNADLGCRTYHDHVYEWPEGFAHYLSHHDVRPPLSFIEHVLRRTE